MRRIEVLEDKARVGILTAREARELERLKAKQCQTSEVRADLRSCLSRLMHLASGPLRRSSNT